MQTRARTMVKMLTWQGLGLVTTTLLAFAFTGSWAAGGALALVSTAVGAVFFVVHERAWDRVRWGLRG